jgi:type II secretory pathway pseudopilin PulG
MTSANPNRRRNEAGYTLLLAVFLVAAMIIAAVAAAPSILTEGRREKEAELVWRGEQYERAIGLYSRKFGKYPTKVEDLTKQTNGVRFLRQAYTDPMNKEDGSWRFIYAGPNGQLIGSLRQTNLLQTVLSTPGLGGALTSGGGLQPLLPPGGATGMNQTPGAGQPGQQTNPAANANPLESQPQPLDGVVMGGNIIGVGSKIKKPSLRIYLGGDTYQQWEFIWNPTGQTALPVQAPVNPNANPASTPAPNGGTSPAGPDGQQPQQNPQMPTVNVPPPPQ